MYISQEKRARPSPAQAQPACPTVRNEWRFRSWDYPIFTLLTIVNLTALGAALLAWCTQISEAHNLPLGILTALTFCANVGLWLSRWLTLPLMQTPRPMPVREGWRVGVATTFVPGAESIEMLAETVKAMVAMDYPHDTWVLDEGDDPEVKALCAWLGARHFTRKHMPQYQTESGDFKARTKYGNYNAWLHEVGYQSYDIVAAFDTDHIPAPNFLLQVLGYFNDERVGYVQAAQAYYNQSASFIARGAAEETYAYFSSIQMSSYTMGYPIVTGCHNTHRVSALKEVGGFSAHDADDLLITLLYRVRGWRGVYVPQILARGLTPVDWGGYLNQQRRWARSTLDIKFRIYPQVAQKLPLLERIMSFIHGFYYLRSLIVAMQFMLLVYILMTGAAPAGFIVELFGYISVFFVSMFACDLYRQRFFLDPRREWGIHWRAGFLEYAKWPYFLLALLDTIKGHRGSYTITPKVRTQTKQTAFALPHLLIAGAISAAGGIGLALGHVTGPLLALTSALIVAGSLAVVLTTRLTFPPSYDPALHTIISE